MIAQLANAVIIFTKLYLDCDATNEAKLEAVNETKSLNRFFINTRLCKLYNILHLPEGQKSCVPILWSYIVNNKKRETYQMRFQQDANNHATKLHTRPPNIPISCGQFLLTL